MHALECRIVQNGIFVPAGVVSKFDLVYDEELCLVHESTLRRGRYKSEDVSRAPLTLSDAYAAHQIPLNEKVIFLGWYDVAHYGHWLTEGLARYWYLLLDGNNRDFKIPATWTARRGLRIFRDRVLQPEKTHYPVAFSAFDLRADRFRPVLKPRRFSEIHVPRCSMINRCEIHEPHLDVTRKISRYVSGKDYFPSDSRPVYLSRSRLVNSGRRFLNEGPIEKYCKDNGCLVVYPEQLSLAVQIAIFNTHDVFIGFAGSSFHSILFRQSSARATCVYLSRGCRYPNLDIIDSLMGNESVYIDCCDLDGENYDSYICREKVAISSLRRILRQL